MPNDTALPKFLYAILNQKCLSDIDWDKVAKHPVLEAEISNGHAARMRYFRFRKAMEALARTASARRPRGPKSPKSPRRSRVEKNKSPKKEQRTMSDPPGELKFETTPEMTPDVVSRRGTSAPAIKSEGRESEMPATPPPPAQPLSYLEPTASPSPGQSFGHNMADMNDPMYHSFGLPGYDMEAPMISGGGFGTGLSPMSMGMGMGTQLGDSYDLWGHDGLPHNMGAEAGAQVKKEPQWDDAYCRQL